MKIRNGFVSNSSSSSFVIAYKPSEKCPTCGHFPDNLISRIVESDCYDTHVVSQDYEHIKNQLHDWFSDEFSPKAESAFQDAIKLMDNLKSQNYQFAQVTISNHDYDSRELLSGENIVIIHSESY